MSVFRTLAYYHTPPETYRHIFHSVLRAGHHRVAPDFKIGNWPYPGHDLILSVAGSATVQLANRFFTIEPGDLAWIDCHHIEACWARRSTSWEFLWIHIDSEQANGVGETLGVGNNPIFPLRNKTAGAVAAFKSVLGLLRTRPVAMDAALHAAVASLLSILFEVRQVAASIEAQHEARSGHNLAKVLNAMRVEYQKRWKVRDLARLMSLSVPQFFRRFSKATGSTPIDWLRRERINHAKRRLAETHDTIGSIAEGVGYADPHYFSRDFKKLVGVTPRHYRAHENTLHANDHD
jgi:AraC-like DNA-binding protein